MRERRSSSHVGQVAQTASPYGLSFALGFLLLFLLALYSALASAENESAEPSYPEETWGIGLGVRFADIPYVAQDQTVADLIPLLFFENEKFFIRGLEGGIKLHTDDDWQVNALTRYRFFDVPREVQNQIRGDAWDFGFQFKKSLGGNWKARAELLTNRAHRPYANVGIETFFGDDYAGLWPYVGLRLKPGAFNDTYYGLDVEHLGSGVDFVANVEGRYHLTGNLYLIGRLGGYYLDRRARQSSLIKDEFSWEAFTGIAFFNDPDRKRKTSLSNGAYWRVAYGVASTSSVGEILTGNSEKDPFNNKLTSIFYGHPLTDDLFGLPIDLYLTPGLVYHHNSEVQDEFFEYVIAIKAYYTVRLPVRLRFGFAEGMSYASQISYVERTELEQKGYRPSKLLNYLDFSLDFNVGDLFGTPSARRLWFGYSLHHRSGIFETNSQFGRIKGGSNYNTLYLQWHY